MRVLHKLLMEKENLSIPKKSLAFSRKFNCNPMILFVGKGTNNDELNQLASCPWSCVLTTRTDAAFSAAFQNDERFPVEYVSREQIPIRPLNRNKLPVLRLFGVEGQSADDAIDDEKFLESLNLGSSSPHDDNARSMLQLLPGLLDCVNQMAVTGYRPDNAEDVPFSILAAILLKVPNGNIQFWGVQERDSFYPQLQKIAQRKGFILNEERLCDIIGDFSEDVEIPTSVLGVDHYFVNKSPVAIDDSDLLPYGFIGTLLTEHLVYANQPYGKLQYEKWFANFLELSPTNGPQWYGYLPRSTFYVKRSYEDSLVYITRRLLNGHKSSECGPVVLAGDPGSSKSVTLGALAYQIYNEKICPVIYIHKDNLIFYDGSPELDALDRLMQNIERNHDGVRILVVWDSASYRSGVKHARELVNILRNRGRRFVLVCSAYNTPQENTANNKIRYYRIENTGESFRTNPCDKISANIIQNDKTIFVLTTRMMNERELVDLKGKFREYSGIPAHTLQNWFDRLDSEKNYDIFDYLYRFIALLRPHLEEGLSREQQKVAQYVNENLADILERKTDKSNNGSIAQAFLRAGLKLEDFPEIQNVEISEDEKKADSSISLALERFNMAIALFSRFHLDIPSNLAFSLLLQGSDDQNIYSTNNFQLLRFATTIPWLYYGEGGNDGNFVFRFRNSLEATIFLEKHSCTGQDQLDLVSNIIDDYIESYRKTNCIDGESTYILQSFLRLMGPNSRYFQSQTVSPDHTYIQKHLDLLINKLTWMLNDCNVPDPDMGFSAIVITFTREFYGKDWSAEPTPESYVTRLERLRNAICFAQKCILQLDRDINEQDDAYLRRHLSEQKDTLVVEIVQCNSLLQSLEAEYRNDWPENYPAFENLNYISYPVIFRMLDQVILKQPNNGYPYNVLFKAFLTSYTKEDRPEIRMQFLSEIMQIVSVCNDIEIYNRGAAGKDELTENMAAIEAISNQYEVSIDEIHHRVDQQNDTYLDLFDKLLEANNPAAITFICQKELARANIVFRSSIKLKPYQIMACKKVQDFMREPENFACICMQPRALAMLIRVSWMCYNETSLTSSEECQSTRLKLSEWLDICNLCKIYVEREERDRYQPILLLLYALSVIHVDQNFSEALHILTLLKEGQFYGSPRMWTPFLLCDDDGTPLEYNGKVMSSVNNKSLTGKIWVNDVSNYLSSHSYVRFRSSNLGMNTMPTDGTVFKDLNLGLSYTGLSAYRKAGLRDRGDFA